MTQIFGENGKVDVATVLATEEMTVSQVKTKEKDGYTALQVGVGSKKEHKLSKPARGHLKDLGLPTGTGFAVLKEFRVSESTANRGDKLTLESFNVGDKVTASALSKGKGFQGVVKRHGFKGGPRSHGQKHSEREPGSIGGSGGRAGGRVAKGMRMAGRMGGNRRTVKNLKVLALDKENNFIFVSGAIPGRRGTLVELISENK